MEYVEPRVLPKDLLPYGLDHGSLLNGYFRFQTFRYVIEGPEVVCNKWWIESEGRLVYRGDDKDLVVGSGNTPPGRPVVREGSVGRLRKGEEEDQFSVGTKLYSGRDWCDNFYRG